MEYSPAPIVTERAHRQVDVWAGIDYPLSVGELQRLSRFGLQMDARNWVHAQQLPCSVQEAKRLAFVKWLVTSRRLSETAGVPA